MYMKKSSFSSFRATPVLGFLPQELLGTSMYEYYHHDDIPHLAESHKAALQTSERVTTQVSFMQSFLHENTFLRFDSQKRIIRDNNSAF